MPDVPSATFVKAMGVAGRALGERDNLLLLSGVSPDFVRMAERSGLLDVLGRENLLPADDEIFSSTRDAIDRGQAWVDDHRDARTADEGAPT